MRRHLVPLALLLLAAGCLGIDATPKELTLYSGQIATAKIAEKHWFSGSVIEIAPGNVTSSDTNVATVEGTPGTEDFTVRALHAGTANLVAGYTAMNVATVHVVECVQGSLTPSTAVLTTRAGLPVHLNVKAAGLDERRIIWYEERVSGWSMIPFATGTTYDFTPRATGVYRLQARYEDFCGVTTATFTITATTRTRAVAH